jgi:hypothetical protein
MFSARLSTCAYVVYGKCDSYDDGFDDLYDIYDESFYIIYFYTLTVHNNMPAKLPESLRLSVIQQWLAGHQRDKIAFDNGISAGAVTNIVDGWRMSLGSYAADELRDLAVTLKKIGTSPAQCAVGFRVATMLRRFGVQEDKFESFVSDIHNRCCNELGLTPECIGFYIANLAEISHTVPISQIPNYISQKLEEKKRIEEQIQELEGKMKELQTKKSELERFNTSALENYRITQEKLRWYSDIKEELEKKYGIPVYDISKLGAIVNDVRNLFGYDVKKVVHALSNLQSLKNECEKYQAWIAGARSQYYSLDKQCSDLQGCVDSCNQSLDVYGQLYDMEFGLKQLKLLWRTIVEIAYANNISKEDAGKKFFKDIEEHYDDKLGFESKIHGLQEEIDNLNQRKLKLLAEISAFPKLGAAVAKLFSIDGNNNSVEDFDLLIGKVQMAGGIKAAIAKLSGQPIVDGKSLVSPNNDDGGTKSSSIEEIEKEEKVRAEPHSNNDQTNKQEI